MHIETSTLGVMDTPERQMEYMLVCSAVNCAIRNKGEWVALVSNWFKSEYIQDAHFRRLYTDVIRMLKNGDPVTDHILALELHVDGSVFGTKAAEMYGLMVDSSSQGGNVRYYAKKVYDAYRRIAASEDIQHAADDMREANDPNTVLDELPEIKSKYASSPENRTEDNNEIGHDILMELEGKKDQDKVSTGIQKLDEATGGLTPGVLMVVAGPSSGGKSVMMGQMALHCAVKHQKTALVFSYEMTPREIYIRWACVLSKTPFKNGDRRLFIGGLSQVTGMTKNGGLLQVFNGGSMTIEEVGSAIRSYCQTVDVGLVVIDYLQIVAPTNIKVPREQQVAHIVNAMKQIAQETGVPVVTGSQLNEEGRVRESRAIVNAANIVVKLDPNDDRESESVDMNIYLDKNRDGGLAHVVVRWDKPIFTLRDKDYYDCKNLTGDVLA